MSKVLSSLPMLKECCCGCSLKTGSMIIGFITLVWASVLTVVAATSIISGDPLVVADDQRIDTVFQVSVLLARIVQAAVSLLLIIATHKERASLILPWLAAALLAVMVEGISLIIMLSHLAIGDINPRIFSMATHVSVTVYFFFVVFSFYREINNKSVTTMTA